jgi:hypothetical protein
MAKITTFPLFKGMSLGAGTSGTSDVIDLRYCSGRQMFSILYDIAAGTATTCGTTTFSYVGCSTKDGTFVSPQALGTFGTSGTGKTESKLMSFGTAAVILTPFMKIIATQTGVGGAGANSKVTAELHVQ